MYEKLRAVLQTNYATDISIKTYEISPSSVLQNWQYIFNFRQNFSQISKLYVPFCIPTMYQFHIFASTLFCQPFICQPLCSGCVVGFHHIFSLYCLDEC